MGVTGDSTDSRVQPISFLPSETFSPRATDIKKATLNVRMDCCTRTALGFNVSAEMILSHR